MLPQLQRGAAARHRPERRRSTAPTTIRASLHDTELTLLIAVGAGDRWWCSLFLRNCARHADPGVAVPVSMIGTFGAMYLLGYSLDNLSLMALTIATGFVVDDAIVVLENITRHIEDGHAARARRRCSARARSASPSLSISMSLIAVFLPILLMGGIVGRLFREFAVTLSIAILVSLVDLADHHADDVRAVLLQAAEPARGALYSATRARVRPRCCAFYERTLALGAAPSALS